MKTLRTLAFIGSVVIAGRVLAMYAMLQPVPVARLLASAEAFRAAHPTLAEAHYTLARIHYLGFALNSREVPGRLPYREVFPADDVKRMVESMPTNRSSIDLDIPSVPADWMIPGRSQQVLNQQKPWGFTNTLSVDELVGHVVEAISGFREAMRLEKLPTAEVYPRSQRGPPVRRATGFPVSASPA